MKTKKPLKFSKETVVVLDNKVKKTIMGGKVQQVVYETWSCARGC